MNSPDIKTDTVIIEIKTRLSAVRGVRDALVGLVKLLSKSSRKRAYLLLIDPRISTDNLEKELTDFKEALRSDISNRLFLVTAHDGKIDSASPDISPSDFDLIKQQISISPSFHTMLPRPDMQSEVFRALLLQWINQGGPMTSDWLANTVGCSYRTVAKMIEKLGPAVDRQSDRRVKLKHFPKETWTQFLAVAPKARATIHYYDHSDQPRSAESLVRRLKQLGRKNIAIGGVIGAKRYFPKLDIIGIPRLDLCLHTPQNTVDLEFVKQLDPALERSNNHQDHARLSLHFIRRKTSFFKTESDLIFADPVECLADLFEARLDLQASEFETSLIERRQSSDA